MILQKSYRQMHLEKCHGILYKGKSKEFFLFHFHFNIVDNHFKMVVTDFFLLAIVQAKWFVLSKS